MTATSRSRRLAAGAIGSAALLAVGTSAASADGGSSIAKRLGFTPITSNALPCSASGYAQFANDRSGNPMVPRVLMSAGDPAKPVNAPATSTKVGAENDMNALDPDGKYLFTVSEAGASDGVTRLTLKGRNKGRKEVLAYNAPWSRIDGVKWYPGADGMDDEGDDEAGVLLISEEFGAGGIWQVDPISGAFARLSWMGDFAHEGIGLDVSGNLYLGDENRAGAIYKAVPNDPSDLTLGGSLYYLVSTTVDPSGWKAVVDPAKATPEASAGGAVLFDRPEDFDERNGRIYFAATEPEADALTRKGASNQIVNSGGVYSFNAAGVPALAADSGALPYSRLTPMIKLNDPKYTSVAQAKAQHGLQFPDNLAFDGKGNLWVHEDIPDGNGSFPSSGIDVSKQARDQQDELYVFVLNNKGDAIIPNPSTAGPAVSGGYKAADMRTSPLAGPCENEFSGGIFDEEGKTLYINQQHADNPTLKVRIGRSDD